MWKTATHGVHFFWLLVLSLVLTGCGSETKVRKQPSPAAQLGQAKKISDPEERSPALTKVALRYLESGDNRGARSALLQANDAAEEIKRRNATKRAAAYTLLAAAWYQVEGTNDDQCKDAYRDAEKSARKIGDPVEKTEAFLNLAELKTDIDKKSDVTKHLRTGTEGIEAIDDPVERVRLLGKIARFYVKIGKPSDANATIQAAVKLAETDQDSGTQAKLFVQIAQEQIAVLKDRESGMANLDRAKQLADTLSSNPNRKANLLIDIARVFIATGEKPQARELLDTAEKLCRGRSECKPAMNRIGKIRDQM